MGNFQKKPTFDITKLKVEIKGIPTIEENMKQVKQFALDLKDYYQNLVFHEEDIKEAKEEKAKVNKMKTEIDNIRKTITKEYNKPLESFVSMSKETATILEETYGFINAQVTNYELLQKDEIELELRDFFADHIKHDVPELEHYLRFEDCKVNITLSASMKSMKDKILTFIEALKVDLAIIGTEEYRDEIFAEYFKDFNYARAKLDVLNRKMELEKIKQRQEKLAELQEQEEQVVEKVDEVVAPIEVESIGDWTTNEVKYIPKVSLTLYEVADFHIGELKQWLEERKIKYE